jgi:protein gp37
MAENSHISWTDHTFNAWWGCVEVSPACTFCYAKRDDARWHSGNPHWGKDGPRRFWNDGSQKAINHWNEPLKWNAKAEKEGVRKRVFCMSMGDIFELLPGDHPQRKEMEIERHRAFKLMEKTPWLYWLMLTKRPENWRLTPELWQFGYWPSNVLFGMTVEDHKRAMERLQWLRVIPAPCTFLSCEPLFDSIQDDVAMYPDRISWLITGGESGPKARPNNPDHYRELRDWAVYHNIPFHFKQWGEWREPLPGEEYNTLKGRAGNPPAYLIDNSGHVHCTREVAGRDAIPVIRVGRQVAGRELDGRTWDEFPGHYKCE